MDIIPDQTNYNTLPFKLLDFNRVDMPSENFNNRLTNRIYVKGIKVCFEIINTTNIPTEFHWAIIQGKETESEQDVRTDFFRADNGTGGDTLTFSNGGAYDIRYKCNPLNPANKRIITHRKVLIGGITASGDSVHERKYFFKHDKYYPIKRTVHFDNNNDIINEKPWNLVFWCMPMDGAQHVQNTEVPILKYQIKTHVYFKNIV